MQSYISKLVNAINQQDGDTVADLMAYDRPFIKQKEIQFISQLQDCILAHIQVNQTYHSYLKQPELIIQLSSLQINLAQ